MRYAFLLLLCFSQLAYSYDFKPGISVAVGVVSSQKATPPNPDSDICSNCGGDGELGDGTTVITCPVCDGTGRITQKEVAPLWHTSFEVAERVSLETGKPLLIYIYSDNCAPCTYFNRWQSEVNLSNFVLLKLNARYSNYANVDRTPTHVLRRYGREVGRWVGLGNLKNSQMYQQVLDTWNSQAQSLSPHR